MNSCLFKFKIPDHYSNKEYKFIFIGIEDKNQSLIHRIDTEYSDKEFAIQLDASTQPDKLIFIGYELNNQWEDKKIILDINDFLITPYDDIVLPYYNKRQNIQIHPSEFNTQITVVFIDENHDEELKKLTYMYNSIGITNIKILNSKTIDIPKITSLEEYSEFVLKKLHEYIDTEFCLICQWDGFIINYNKLKRDFFDYDYIGAPICYDSKCEIGNGGFSLRSKKFLQTTAELFKESEIDEPEDLYCQTHIDKLKNAGLKFPPFNIKDEFSIEHQQYSGQFGFHGFMTKGLPPVARQFYKNKFHHSGDLGDIIFSLPTMKALGGGVLILTNDLFYFRNRCQLTIDLIRQFREFLNKQYYIIEVYNDERFPCDIDYDLNEFRLPQLLHYTGQMSNEEREQFEHDWKYDTITKHHLKAFNCDLKSDIEPWLTWHKKTVYENKPIIINRTARYQNPQFPWRQICQKYKKYIYFVGTYNEYRDFVADFGEVDYLKTPTIVSLVETIIGCKLLIGNMSFPVAIAEGFKHNCLVESGINPRSNNYIRHNIYVPDPDNIIVGDVLNYIEEYVGF